MVSEGEGEKSGERQWAVGDGVGGGVCDASTLFVLMITTTPGVLGRPGGEGGKGK